MTTASGLITVNRHCYQEAGRIGEDEGKAEGEREQGGPGAGERVGGTGNGPNAGGISNAKGAHLDKQPYRNLHKQSEHS